MTKPLDRGPSPSSDDSTVSDISNRSSRSTIGSAVTQEKWYLEGLTIIVVGASGDLAKKKTYPSLLNLYDDNLLPEGTIVWGYARSKMSHEELRARIKPYLLQTGNHSEKIIDEFLSLCFYQAGKAYGDIVAFKALSTAIHNNETKSKRMSHNRVFYFAIPPNVFGESAMAIKQVAMADKGWSRIIVEKPFGRDLESCVELSRVLSSNFDEHHLYRIDHYLGKELVQNLMMLRFGNSFLEWIWNRNAVASVIITFKEPFGTEGRGGYFDKYGIIRDILQNHLLQVLSLVAMEPPLEVDGIDAGCMIRDSKVQILKAIPPIKLEDCILGQYEGYADDPTIENKDTNTPTFAAIRCFVNNTRWAGVPFILKAGKALDERKCEVRVQLKNAPGAAYMFDSNCPRNELVMRLQPNEAIYMKTNVKQPGFSTVAVQKDLELNYNTQFDMNHRNNPDAYTRLMLDVLRGKQAPFVRDDELKRSWEIFTPLLHQIERENTKPLIYEQGTRGPKEADDFIAKKCDYIEPMESGTLQVAKE